MYANFDADGSFFQQVVSAQVLKLFKTEVSLCQTSYERAIQIIDETHGFPMLHEHTQTLKLTKLTLEKFCVLILLRDTENKARDLKRRGFPSVVDEALGEAFEDHNLADLMNDSKFDK